MAECTELGGNLKTAFGFDWKIEDENRTSFTGKHEYAEWYVSMTDYGVTVCFTDVTGKSVWFDLDNDDNCRSGFEASILCKYLVKYINLIKSNGRKIIMRPSVKPNGRTIRRIWFTQD